MSAAGAALCLYALHVERNSKDVSYKPLCDFSRNVSCSDVLTSPQAHPLSYIGFVKKDSSFDVPIAALGLVFYILMSTFPFGRRNLRSIYIGVSTVSVIFSCVLAYGLASVFQKICPVCVGTSMINCAILGALVVGRPHKERIRPIVADQKRKRG